MGKKTIGHCCPWNSLCCSLGLALQNNVHCGCSMGAFVKVLRRYPNQPILIKYHIFLQWVFNEVVLVRTILRRRQSHGVRFYDSRVYCNGPSRPSFRTNRPMEIAFSRWARVFLRLFLDKLHSGGEIPVLLVAYFFNLTHYGQVLNVLNLNSKFHSETGVTGNTLTPTIIWQYSPDECVSTALMSSTDMINATFS